MQPRHWIILGAVLGGLGVGLGALGAHGMPSYLEGRGDSPEEVADWMEDYATAVRYHLHHAPVLVLVGLLSLASQGGRRGLATAGWMFLAGVGLFSGFLYAWVFTGGRFPWMVHLVPIGGVLLIAAWMTLAVWAAAWGTSSSRQADSAS